MSFRCQFCSEAQPPATRPNRVITKIRDKAYFNGHPGWEIGEEKNACDVCKDRITSAPERPVLEGKVNFTLSERAQAALADLYHRDPFYDEDLQTRDVQ